MNREYRCYDIVLADLGDNMIGSEQGGKRPCVIIQNLKGQLYSTTTIVFPCTSKSKNLYQPTHTILRKSNGSGLTKDSVVLGEAITQIDERRIIKYIGTVKDPHEKMELRRIYESNPGWDD